jgi:hypothetical protein
MANIRLAYVNRYTAAATVLAASSAVSALPVEATQNTDRNYLWQSATGTGVQTIDIDLGAVVAVTCVALANAKVLGTGVIELYERGDAGTAGSATLVATLAAQDAETRAVAAFFASQSHRHWQLKWTNPTAASDYAALGYAFLGQYLEPAVNVMVPISLARRDPSMESASADGQKSFVTRTPFVVGELRWDAVLAAQLDQLRALFEAVGVRQPCFIVLDTALSWTTWFARVAGPLAWELEPGGALARYGVSLPFEEVR